jgi:hypothetical protein
MTQAYFAINGTVLSDHVSSLELNDEADKVDITGMTTNQYKQYTPGLKDGGCTVTFFSDFAAASTHAIIQPLYQSGGTFAVEIRPTQNATSSTNPKCTYTARVYAYSGIAGGVGDAATFDCEFANAGTAGLVWGTT